MGGVVDHSSNLPDPVAMSSAEAEYNEGCTALKAAQHLRMLLAELEGSEESKMAPTNIYFLENALQLTNSQWFGLKQNSN